MQLQDSDLYSPTGIKTAQNRPINLFLQSILACALLSAILILRRLTMNVLITSGSGHLGRMLSKHLLLNGHYVTIADITPPPDTCYSRFEQCSIVDRSALASAMKGVDVVVHVAALHGIHEARSSHTPSDF
jgi:hypothetical protein